MGLDSVELLWEVEKYFDIIIPDSEAPNVITIQDFADCIYRYITPVKNGKCQSQALFYRFRTYAVETLGFERDKFFPETLTSDFIYMSPEGRGYQTWVKMQEDLDLKLPPFFTLALRDYERKSVKFLGVPVYAYNISVKYPITEASVRSLINWVLSSNYERFFDSKQLTSKEDVERILMALISEKVGIPIYELKLEHSLTNDLGID
jgi:hypothetical protein